MSKVNHKGYKCAKGHYVKVDAKLLPRMKNKRLNQLRRHLLEKRGCEYKTRSDFRENAGDCEQIGTISFKFVSFDEIGEMRNLIAQPCKSNSAGRFAPNQTALFKAKRLAKSNVEEQLKWFRAMHEKYSQLKFKITPAVDTLGQNMLIVTVFDNNGVYRDVNFNMYYDDDGTLKVWDTDKGKLDFASSSAIAQNIVNQILAQEKK